jgi:O-antigen/teichoic acid export membrane protein
VRWRASALARIGRGGVSRIMTGSIVGQGLVFASYPVLSRMFDPADFGLLVVFTSIVSMVGVLSTASLEAAVLIPQSEDEAAAVAWASLSSVALTATVTAGVGLAAGTWVAGFLGAPDLAGYWWLVALTVLVLGVYLVLSEWMVRMRSYGALAKRNLLQGVGQVVAQLGLGAAGVRPVGLLVGLAAGRLLGTGGMLTAGGLLRRRRPRLSAVVAAVRRFHRFPLIASWSKLLNTAGLQVPLLVLSAVYGNAAVGLLGLVVRVVGGPTGVVAQAVYQVFTGEASARLRGSDPQLGALLRRYVRRLLATGAAPALLLVLLGPLLFGRVFGDEWVEAGRFAQILAVGYLAEFAIVPITQVLWLLERQGLQLAWDATRLVLTAGGVALCGVLGTSMTVAVTVLAAAHVTSYAVLYVLSVRMADRADRAAPPG